MTLSLADRSQKTTGIKILSQVGVDPDQDRKTLLKVHCFFLSITFWTRLIIILLQKEEERLRQSVRVKQPRKRGDGPARAHSGGNAYREEDGSDEDGAISLNAIKNKYKSGHVPNKGCFLVTKSWWKYFNEIFLGGAIYSSDEEGSDFETRRSRKSDKPKVLKVSESSEESE